MLGLKLQLRGYNSRDHKPAPPLIQVSGTRHHTGEPRSSEQFINPGDLHLEWPCLQAVEDGPTYEVSTVLSPPG